MSQSAPPPSATPPSATPRRARRAWSVRFRVIALVVAMLALGLTVAGAVTFTVQFNQLNQRIETELLQEVEEFRNLAQRGPIPGEGPFTDLDDLFRAFLQASVPGEHESMVTMTDGQTAFYPGGELSFDLNLPEVRDEVARLHEPGRAVITDFDLDGRQLRMVVAAVSVPQDTRQGALVVAIDAGAQRRIIWNQMGTYALVALGTMILTGLTGYLVAGRLLRPLGELSHATATINTDDLTGRVKIRSADNDVAQLAENFNQMLDRLEAGVADQRQFLDDAAHELRTPLTIIRGNLELMEVGDAEDVDSTRTLVLEELDRMKRLVDDLLMLARSQRPGFVEFASVDVLTLGHEIRDRVHLLADRRWNTLVTARGTILGDRQRLQQAVLQLAANAAKFSPPGSAIDVRLDWSPPSAEVMERLRPAAPTYLVLSVQDRGSGVPADDLARIFDRFGRASEHRSVEGSGLGLPIVVAIAQAHRGTVTLDSRVGVGSTFRLWVPAVM